MRRVHPLVALCSIVIMSLAGQLEGQSLDQTTFYAQWRSPKTCPQQGLRAFGQALYWKYTGTWTIFVLDSGMVVAPNVQQQTINHYNYPLQWGYRVGLDWRCGCFYSELSYLRLDRKRHVEAIGRVSGAFNNLTALTRGLLGVEYQNIDLTVGADVYCYNRFVLQLYGGGRWIFLEETSDINPQTPNGLAYLKDRSQYNAGAFKLGGGAHVKWGCVDLFGTLDGLALFGVQRSDFLQLQPGSPTFAYVNRPLENDALNLATGLGVSLGLKYHQLCGCWTFSAELGYEIQAYFDVLRPTNRPGDGARAFSSGDAGFGGPYGSLKFGY